MEIDRLDTGVQLMMASTTSRCMRKPMPCLCLLSSWMYQSLWPLSYAVPSNIDHLTSSCSPMSHRYHSSLWASCLISQPWCNMWILLPLTWYLFLFQLHSSIIPWILPVGCTATVDQGLNRFGMIFLLWQISKVLIYMVASISSASESQPIPWFSVGVYFLRLYFSQYCPQGSGTIFPWLWV